MFLLGLKVTRIMDYDFDFHKDRISKQAWIAPNATVCGDVTIGKDSSVWFQSVIRGDTESISIGNATNVQDLCLIHADAGKPCRIGDRVTLGHAAIVHGAIVEDDVMIGIRATILNEAVIGSGSLIASGALVPERTVIPPNSVVMGIPGKVVREVTSQDRARIAYAANHYVEASKAIQAQTDDRSE